MFAILLNATTTTASNISFDGTITISILLALCALVAPSFTARINNKHQYRMRKLELAHDEYLHFSSILYEKKIVVYQKFLSQVSDFPYLSNPWENQEELTNTIHDALLLCDSDTRSLLLDFLKIVDGSDGYSRQSALDLITKITLSFNKELLLLSMKNYDNCK